MASGRFEWAKSLLTGSISYLGAAALTALSETPSYPNRAEVGAFAVIAAGLGGAVFNHTVSKLLEAQSNESAERNHLVRYGMAEALDRSLRDVQKRFRTVLPHEPYEDLFESWFAQLRHAMVPESGMLEILFPLDIAEAHWDALTRYAADHEESLLCDASAQAHLLGASDEQDINAIAGILRNLAVDTDRNSRGLLRDRLLGRWDEQEAKRFARSVVPHYRLAFATIFSQGGPKSLAVGYKGMTLTLEKLGEIEAGIEGLRACVTKGLNDLASQHAAHADRVINAFQAEMQKRFPVPSRRYGWVDQNDPRRYSKPRAKGVFGGAPGPRKHTHLLASVAHPIGRDSDISAIREKWLNGSKLPLLVCGPPGIGKSTFARAILRDAATEQRFGERRYEVRCDDISTTEELVLRVARDWFGITKANPQNLIGLITSELAASPCALLIDNFETLSRHPDYAVRNESRSFLSRLVAIRSAWLIVGSQGREMPCSVEWHRFEPCPLSLDDSRKLFVRASRKENTSVQLTNLLKELDGVPGAIELLGSMASNFTNIQIVVSLWFKHKTAIFPPSRDHSREESIIVAYEVAFSALSPQTAQALSVLSCLPAGLHESDADAILPGGSLSIGKLISSAVSSYSNDRLTMLKPLRDHIEKAHTPTEDEYRKACEYFLALSATGSEIGVFKTSETVARLTAEQANLLWAVGRGLDFGYENALDAAVGLAAYGTYVGLDVSDLVNRALEEGRRRGDRLRQANCLKGLGDIARVRSNYELSTQHYMHSKELFACIQDLRGAGWCLWGLGDIAISRNEYDQASALYKDALSAFASANEQRGEGWCFKGLAEIQLMENNFREAKRLYLEARKKLYASGDQKGEAWCLRDLAQIARLEFDYSRAIQLNHEAIEIFRKAVDPHGEAGCYWDLGLVAQMRHALEEADEYYSRGLPLFKMAGDRGEAWSLQGLGSVARLRGDYANAEAYYHRAVELFRASAEKIGEGHCLWGLAEIARIVGKETMCFTLYSDAMALYRSAHYKRGEGACIAGMAEVALVRNEREKAASGFHEAVGLFDQIGDRLRKAACVERLGDMATGLEAMRTWSQAEEIYQSVDDLVSVARLTDKRDKAHARYAEQVDKVEKDKGHPA